MATEQVVSPVAVKKKSKLASELRRLPWAPLSILLVLLFIIAFANFLTPHSPYTIVLPNRLAPPMWQEGGTSTYPLGTDTLGRDLLTRIFFGARVSLFVAVVVLTIGGGAGLALGIIAGYMGGWLDAVIMRAVDSLMALPPILFALTFAVTLGPSMQTVILALSLVSWARFARVIRGDVLSLVNREYILQAKVAGCSTWRIMLVHISPNVLNTFMILLSLNVGWVILIEASLSFLGAGIPPPAPSWGQMVSEGRGYITSAWWIAFFPGLALASTVLAFQLFGDWLRDRLDPKLRQL